MKKPVLSTKRIAIDKANSRLFATIGIATFVTIFSIFACKALISQGRYQSKVINQKKVAVKQLEENEKAVQSLNNAYQEFAKKPINVLGGNPTGTGDKDGDNPRIVLDALPSQYDFPALTTSVEKMLKENNYPISNISGTDDEIAQAKKISESNPQAIEIPFTFEAVSSPNLAKNLLGLLERSIRPIQVQKVTITEQGGNLGVSVDAKTFFQPGKSLDIKSEVVN